VADGGSGRETGLVELCRRRVCGRRGQRVSARGFFVGQNESFAHPMRCNALDGVFFSFCLPTPQHLSIQVNSFPPNLRSIRDNPTHRPRPALLLLPHRSARSIRLYQMRSRKVTDVTDLSSSSSSSSASAPRADGDPTAFVGGGGGGGGRGGGTRVRAIVRGGFQLGVGRR
jgi:hypothetical protein